MDHSTLALTFAAIIFPIFAAGGTGLPLVNSNTPRIILLPIQFFLFAFAILDLGIAVYISLYHIQALPTESRLALFFFMGVTIVFLIWILFTLMALAVEEQIYESSTERRRK
jgi:uncharacterized membrane protein